MRLTSFATVGMASLVSCVPTIGGFLPNDYGYLYYNDDDVKGWSYVSGGCLAYPSGPLNAAEWPSSIRCRFYKDDNCVQQIGTDEGLLGGGRISISEEFQSLTCWYS
jgi:hypothetical protein